MSSIFSSYCQGENRITSTILSVFERINTATLVQILQNIFDDSTIELIKFSNQIKGIGSSSVPDGRIQGNFDYLIETKSPTAELTIKQLQNHLHYYDINTHFVIITPDQVIPTTCKIFIENNPKKK